MSFDEVDPDTQIMATSGRRFPYATVGQWIALADLPAQSVRLYDLLRAHCNTERADDLCWPTQEQLAEMMRLSKRSDVGKYTKPLVAIGAVETAVQRWGPNRMYKRIVYTVHEAPPRGYPGLVSIAQWHAARKELPAHGHDLRKRKERAGRPDGAKKGTTDGPLEGISGGPSEGT